jgi:hypothetical protein
LEEISYSKFTEVGDNRGSVYDYVKYFGGEPVPWESKASKIVSLSSTEAE